MLNYYFYYRDIGHLFDIFHKCIILMISKFLFKKLIKHPIIISFSFARNIKKAQPQLQQPLPQYDVQQVTQEERIMLNKQHGRELRQKKIFSHRNRRQRQQDEKLEKDIIKLMNQGKSDRQILKIMGNAHRNKKSKQTKEQDKEQINLQTLNNKQIEKQKLLIAQQQALINEMKKTSNLKQQKINKEMYYQKKQQDFNIEYNLTKERLVQQAIQNSTQQNIKQITSNQLNQYRIPKEFRKSVELYKNNQMKYFHELIQNPSKTGTKMNTRTSKIRNQGVNQIINKKKQKQQTYSPIQNKKQIKYQLPQESLEQIKQRKIIMYEQQQNSTSEDLQFIKKGQKDLQLVNKNISSIFLSQRQKKDINKLEYEQSSFGKQDQRINKTVAQLKELGFNADIDQIRQMDKQFIFSQKKRLENLEQYNKYQQRKQKLEKIKQLRRKIHQNPYHDKLDYLKFDTIQGFNPKKHKLTTGFPDVSKLDQINQKYARSVFKSENDWDYQYIRTIENMESWIYFQVYNKNKQSLNIFNNIDITNVIPNDSLTVLNLIWEKKSIDGTSDKKNKSNNQVENDQQIKKLNQHLNKYSQYLSGKMCQQLQLKYGPDIRFHYFKKSEQYTNAKQMLIYQMPQIIKAKLKQEYQKGKLPQKMKLNQFNNMIKQIQDNFIQKVDKIDNPEKMINKKKRKSKDQKEPKVRNNRTQDGKRKKTQKKLHRSEQFWNQL